MNADYLFQQCFYVVQPYRYLAYTYQKHLHGIQQSMMQRFYLHFLSFSIALTLVQIILRKLALRPVEYTSMFLLKNQNVKFM